MDGTKVENVKPEVAVEDDPNVDLTLGSRKLWLVKFTEEMYNAWVDAEPGTELGSVKIYDQEKPMDKQHVMLTVNDIEGISEKTPRQYDLSLNDNTSQGLLVLREDKEKKKKTMIGGIGFRGVCTPRDKRYKSLVKSRFEKASDRAATIEYKVNDRIGNRLLTKKHVFTVTAQPDQIAPQDQSDKRVRVSEKELENMLFNAFTQHQYYGLKDLVTLTNQPQDWVRTILRNLCVYHTKGKMKNLYELKPEYRSYKVIDAMDDDTAEPDSADE
eukprot:CFRG4466T1